MRCARTAALLVLLGIHGAAQASEQLWALLKGGGQVVLMRHAITTPGVGDPPGMRLDDCSTQRNLTDEGRRHARQTGEVFRARGVAVDRVRASPWCRCLETARLAFGKAEVLQPSAICSGGLKIRRSRFASCRLWWESGAKEPTWCWCLTAPRSWR